MHAVSQQEFVSLLRELGQEEFTAFVGEVWRARGYDVVVESQKVLVRTDNGEEKLFWVNADAGWFSSGLSLPASDIDAIVSNATRRQSQTEDCIRIIDATELQDIVLYAINRSLGEELCQRYFGRSITRVESSHGPRGESILQNINWEGFHLWAGGMLLLILVVIMIAGPITIGETSIVTSSGTAINSTPVPSVPPPSTPHAASVTQDQRTPIDIDHGFLPPGLPPPGLTRRGINDAQTLASGHANQLSGQSYKLTLTYREENSNEQISIKRERIFVENSTVYMTDIDGKIETESYLISDVEVYADGENRYIRQVTPLKANYSIKPIPSYEGRTGPIEARVELYLELLFSAEASYIRNVDYQNGKRIFTVITKGDSWPDGNNATSVLKIDSDGLVHFARRSYITPNSNGTEVSITINYDDRETTTVQPPKWHQTAVNESIFTPSENMS